MLFSHSKLLVLLLTCTCTLDAIAQSGAGSETPTEPLWELHAVGVMRYGASYPGSSESQFNFVPLPFPRYRGKFLRLGESTQSPLRGRVFRRDRIKLDLDFDIHFGADSKDIAVRNGMPDLNFMLEGGPRLSLQFVNRPAGWNWFLNLPFRVASSWDGLSPTYRGVVFSPGLKWQRRFAHTIRDGVSIKLASTFASKRYMGYYYTVAEQFATPSRPAFDAKQGYLGSELSLSARKHLSRKIELAGGVKLAWLAGARNRRSALFEDTVNSSVYIALLYKFWESKRRVPVLD